MADGPAAALPIVDELVATGALAGSHLLPTVRGELLTRLGRTERGARRAGGRRTPVRRASPSVGCWSASSRGLPQA